MDACNTCFMEGLESRSGAVAALRGVVGSLMGRGSAMEGLTEVSLKIDFEQLELSIQKWRLTIQYKSFCSLHRL